MDDVPENLDIVPNRQTLLGENRNGSEINERGNMSLLNISSKPKPLKWRNCYTCHDECVFKAIEIVFLIGVVANICVIILVLKDKKLRTPTFISIGCLACCDAIFISVNLISSMEVVIRSLSCSYPLTYTGKATSTITGICWFAANAHVSVIALVRYVLMLHPLKSQLYLSNRKIMVSSASIWVIGISIWMLIYGLAEYNIVSPSKSVTYVNIIWGIVYFTPLMITVSLHFKKWYFIRVAARKNLSGNGSIQKIATRMSRVILLIIILATVLPLPRFVITCLRKDESSFRSEIRNLFIRDISFLLFLLNHAINPFLYAFMSTPFRKSFKNVFFKPTMQTFRLSNVQESSLST
ncbi:neuromedin-U receptor 2-like [Ruditapes philippinarum]|uniref:neuromedin-U receptor 2-like n=1 Tax=Ruditapes philippinarum TaxID=129788 RepID=UPI00295B49AC|nr:neuromedin-U receptor 2-like [Ruditapes philippinarum]